MPHVKKALQAGGQTCLALLSMAILAAFVRLGLIPSLEGIFDLSDTTISFIRRICMIIAFVAGFWIYVRFAEKRQPTELRFRPKIFLLSGFAGALWIGIPMAILYMTGSYLITGSGGYEAIWGVALVIFAAALLEEIVFRGVLFGVIERHYGFWVGLLAPSLLFGLLHIFNADWGGWLSLISVILLGLMWTLVYALTRNIWAATVNHAVWNFTIFATGLPLTGNQGWRASAPLQSNFSGPDWWVGGVAGPESTVLVIAFVVIVNLALLYAVLRKQHTHSRRTVYDQNKK